MRVWSRRALAGLVATLLAAFTNPIPAGAVEDPNWLANGRSYRIRNFNSGLCAILQGQIGQSGNDAVTWSCESYDDQFWSLHHAGGGYYQLMNYHNWQCLSVADAANNTPVEGRSCGSTGDREEWYIAINSVYSRLENRYSGKCMIAQTANPAAIVQYKCETYPDQYWYQDWSESRLASRAPAPDMTGPNTVTPIRR